jgi:hypothetical protein
MVKMPEQENYFDEQPCTVKQHCSYLLKCNGLQSEGQKTFYPDEIWIYSDVGNKLTVSYCSFRELIDKLYQHQETQNSTYYILYY